MNLNLELLQLYRCTQLVELLEKTGEIFQASGFPHVSLDWAPAPGTRTAMMANTIAVWDNYNCISPGEGAALRQEMALSIQAFLEQDRDAACRYFSWTSEQTGLFICAIQSPDAPSLWRHQRSLISTYAPSDWSEFVVLPVCRERDRVLLFTARTLSTLNQAAYELAESIFSAFHSAYRYLHGLTASADGTNPHLPDAATLSRREIECLQWLASGKTLSEAAIILGITERTLRFHVNNARERLGVATTVQAVVTAALVYGFDPTDTRRSIYTVSRSVLSVA